LRAATAAPCRVIYSNSLGLVMGGIFLGSWLAQSIAGAADFNEEQLSQLQDTVSRGRYLGEPDFWNRTLQNWQSELLAVASMAVLCIYLRQRGSPESKPVGSARRHRDRRLSSALPGTEPDSAYPRHRWQTASHG
jgi:hypothetical protein